MNVVSVVTVMTSGVDTRDSYNINHFVERMTE